MRRSRQRFRLGLGLRLQLGLGGRGRQQRLVQARHAPAGAARAHAAHGSSAAAEAPVIPLCVVAKPTARRGLISLSLSPACARVRTRLSLNGLCGNAVPSGDGDHPPAWLCQLPRSREVFCCYFCLLPNEFSFHKNIMWRTSACCGRRQPRRTHTQAGELRG